MSLYSPFISSVHHISSCRGLIILETYTTQKGEDLQLPDFLEIVNEVTENSTYSMYNLTRMEPGSSQDKTVLDLTLPSSQSLKDKAIMDSKDRAPLDSNKLEECSGGTHKEHSVNGGGIHPIPNGKA